MKKPAPNNSAPTTVLSESELVRMALADEYELLEELGRGGMAVVHRAREIALDREVAIKVLPSRLLLDRNFAERFEHEARTAARLEHPNIVPIYRVGRAGSNGEVSYFVMKLLRGQSIAAVLRERGRLSPPDVRRILLEVASAIGYASKRGVVHRDIKPDNILLDGEGRCVVTDFGIAKSPGGQNTTAGISLGTPRYMSPEHARGEQLDGRSDIYSLGIVAYQCLFGRPPFEADEPFAILYKQIHEPLPEPTMDGDEERRLFGVIARMLAKNPADRFQSANELIAALGGQVTDPTLVATMMNGPGLMAPTEVMPTPRPWTVSHWRMIPPARRRVWMGVSAATVVAAIAMLVVPWVPTTPTDENGSAGSPSRPLNSSISRGALEDSVKAPEPPPEPSPRALAIMAANKVRSSCPKIRDTMPGTPRLPYAVIVDSVRDVYESERLAVQYHVCGLEPGAAFSTRFRLVRPVRLGNDWAHEATQVADAVGLRTPIRWTISTEEIKASPGSYRLEMLITAAGQEPVSYVQPFRVARR